MAIKFLKKTFYYFLLILLPSQVFSDDGCFIAKEKGKVLRKEGDCSTRHPPGCDFSILLSLMGFDSGALKNEKEPELPFKEGYETFLNAWKTSQTPRTWIVNSCVWYSSIVVKKIGLDKIKEYVRRFQYGNQDATGVNGENWPGALQISANEQVDFLQKIVDRTVPLASHSYDMTEKVLFIQDLSGEWKLYGKTGVGEGEGEKRIGWFIGWISKGTRRIVFACNTVYPTKPTTIPSFTSKNRALEKLFWLINELEA